MRKMPSMNPENSSSFWTPGHKSSQEGRFHFLQLFNGRNTKISTGTTASIPEEVPRTQVVCDPTLQVTLHSLPSRTATKLVQCWRAVVAAPITCEGKHPTGQSFLPMVKKTDGTYCRTSSNAPAKVTAKLKERKEREEREVEFI